MENPTLKISGDEKSAKESSSQMPEWEFLIWAGMLTLASRTHEDIP
jgi:hypothetical protein